MTKHIAMDKTKFLNLLEANSKNRIQKSILYNVEPNYKLPTTDNLNDFKKYNLIHQTLSGSTNYNGN